MNLEHKNNNWIIAAVICFALLAKYFYFKSIIDTHLPEWIIGLFISFSVVIFLTSLIKIFKDRKGKGN